MRYIIFLHVLPVIYKREETSAEAAENTNHETSKSLPGLSAHPRTDKAAEAKDAHQGIVE